jgi:hypothetical protein
MQSSTKEEAVQDLMLMNKSTLLKSEVSTMLKALATLTNFADNGMGTDERTRTVSTTSNATPRTVFSVFHTK